MIDLIGACIALALGLVGGFVLRDRTERAKAEAEWGHALSPDPGHVDLDRTDAWSAGYDLAIAGCRGAVFEIDPSAPDLYTVIAEESGKVVAKSISTFAVAASSREARWLARGRTGLPLRAGQGCAFWRIGWRGDSASSTGGRNRISRGRERAGRRDRSGNPPLRGL